MHHNRGETIKGQKIDADYIKSIRLPPQHR